MVLLVVKGEVLDVAVNALGGRAFDLEGSHGPGHVAILGIVFAVTSGEWGPVDVHSWSVPAIRAAQQSLVAHHLAEVLRQLGVPGLGEHHDAWEGLAGASVHPTGGRISIGLERLVHGFDVVHAVAGEVDELVVIVLGELVKDLVPLRSS